MGAITHVELRHHARRCLSQPEWPGCCKATNPVALDQWLAVHSAVPAQQVPIDEAREGQGQEHGAGDGVKLPALRRNLTRAALQ